MLPIVAAAAVSVTTLSCIAVVYFNKSLLTFLRSGFKNVKNEDKTTGLLETGGKLGRKMSFSSAGMAMGAWPEEAQMCEPIINVAMYFDDAESCPIEDDLIPVVEKALEYERFAGVPVGTPGKNDWRFKRTEPKPDPRKFIRKFSVSCDAVNDVIEEHMNESLRDVGRNGSTGLHLPFWEFLVIKNEGKGRSAVCFRMDHVIGDGLSLATVFPDFITYADGSPVLNVLPPSMGSRKKPSMGKKLALMLKTIPAIFQVLSLPMSRGDDNTAFSKTTGKDMVHSGIRKCIAFDPIPLNFVRDLKSKAGVTLNDIMFCALSQAIHDYCALKDCPILKEKGIKVQSRALVPVAFPRRNPQGGDKSQSLRNKWVMVSVDMGVGIKGIMDRLKHLNTTMNELKSSPIAYCQLAVQNSVSPLLPLEANRKAVFDVFAGHSVVFTNVPGPSEAILFAKKKVVGVQMFLNNLLPQVSMLSYNNEVHINMVADNVAIPEIEMIPKFFFKALVSLASEVNAIVPKDMLEKVET